MKRLLLVFALLACTMPAVAQIAPTSQDVAFTRFRTGDDLSWAQPSHDDSTWSAPAWPADHYGFGWYRARVLVTVQGPRVQLHVEHGNQEVWTYVNGHLTGSFFRGASDSEVPRDWLVPGENVIAVRVQCNAEESFLGYEGCDLSTAQLRSSSTDRSGMPVTVSTTRVGNLGSPGAPMVLRSRVINTTTTSQTLSAKTTVSDELGATVAVLESPATSVASGAAVTFAPMFVTERRGIYNATVQIPDGPSGWLRFGVADSPGPRDERFAINIIRGNDVGASAGSEQLVGYDLAKRVGASWMREHLIPWTYVQPHPGEWEWSYFDAVDAASARTGVEVLWNVHRVPYWSLGAPYPSLATSLVSGLQHPPLYSYYDEWAGFFGAAAARYPGGYWEIGNEPDGEQPQYVTVEHGFDDHIAFHELSRLAGGRINASDPSATVVLGGMQRPDDRALREQLVTPGFEGKSFFERFMDHQLTHGGRTFDVFNYHAYRDDALASEGFRLTDRMVKINALMQRYGLTGLERYDSECNTNPPAEADNRISAVRCNVIPLASGTTRVFFFYVADYPDEADAAPWGLFDEFGRPRPAAVAYAAMQRLLSGRAFSGTITSMGVTGYRFGDVTVWWDDVSPPRAIPVAPSAVVKDDYGNLVEHGATLTLGPRALYVAS